MLTKACLPVTAPTVQQHAENNKRLVKISDKIPKRINRLVESQSVKIVEDVKTHASSIIADGDQIQSECKSIAAEYNQLITDVHANKYTDAVQALNDIIANSERVAEQVNEAAQEAEQMNRAIKSLTNPVALAVFTALLAHFTSRSWS